MINKLLSLQKNAYCPITNFPVAAIVVTKDNHEFSGVNVEDATTRAGACAERVALFSMIAAGYKKGDVKEINLLTSGDISTPCFVCRQMIVELCDMKTKINCYNKNGDMKTFDVSELCPYTFSEDDLK